MQLYLPVRSAVCAEAPVATNAAARPTVKDRILMRNRSTTTRSGGYTEPRAQANQGKEGAMSKDCHGRTCPGHPRLPFECNQERGCPGPVSAKASPRPCIRSARRSFSEGGKPGHDDI